MVDMSVNIGRLKLKNPVMAASGTFGPEYGELVDINSLGAYVAKTITLNARIGNPAPRVAESASGMLNSIGLENKGLDDFLKNKLPMLARVNIPIVASISGDTDEEFEKLTRGLDKARFVSAIELNLSCPNVRHASREGLTAQDENAVYEVVSSVRKLTNKVLIAKLSPSVTDITKIALAAERAGADAVSLINTYPAMAVDIDTRRPVLGNVTGGLSGPAIKPIALKMVYDTYRKVKIPIIGIGGIMDHKDAIEFIICGASAVQVGTANFVNPKAVTQIISGMKTYLAKNKIGDIKKLTGRLEK
jgi:dihydroorotate dehydrogenase (NAD+) catalytic subunit